ncbi:MAG: hypothetical protein R3Y51_00995 [Rikenellaceae bacterium]
MKKILFLLIVFSVFSGEVSAFQSKELAAVGTQASRINVLTEKQKSLENKIKIEDQKRNLTDTRVSPEVLERMNDKQDYICLELRSELASVKLEIAEIKKAKFISAVNNAVDSSNKKK